MRTAVMMLAVVGLGACSNEPEVSAKNASVEEVAEKVRKSGAGENFVRPGLWESKVTVQQLEIAGMPPEMAQQMKSSMAQHQPEATKNCLSPEDVKQPKESFFAGKNNNCRYERFDMGDGKIDAVMRCGEGGRGQRMEMSGTYSPDAYQMQMSTKTEVAGQSAERAMDLRLRVDARRIGECTGKEG